MVSLLDDLQLVVASWRFGSEPSVLVMDGIDPHDGLGIGEQLLVLQEPEGEPIRADHQLGCREQNLQLRRRRGELGRPLVTLGEAHGEEPQRDQAGDDGRTLVRPPVPLATPQ